MPRQPGEVPVLTDGVVTLRAYRPWDTGRLVQAVNDPECRRFLPVPHPYDEGDARTFLRAVEAGWAAAGRAAGGHRNWAVVAAQDPGRFLGGVDLNPRAGGTVEVGYQLHPDARGSGLAVRAVRLVSAHAFAGGAPRVHWQAAVGNWASRRVAWAAGYGRFTTLPDAEVDRDGRLRDVWVASLLPAEQSSPTTPWFVPPELAGHGIRLRSWRPADAAHCEPVPEPDHWVPSASIPTTDGFDPWWARRQERMASGQGMHWCIADEATDRPLGEVSVFSRTGALVGPGGELGYFLFPSARGRGVVREAVRLAVGHALDPAGLGLTRLGAVTAPDNVRSNAVLADSGFTTWGTTRGEYPPAPGYAGGARHWERLA